MSKGKRHLRNLDVDGKRWRWNIFRESGNVLIEAPNGIRTYFSQHEVSGVPPDISERGKRKGTSDGHVTPDMVRTFIKNGFSSQRDVGLSATPEADAKPAPAA